MDDFEDKLLADDSKWWEFLDDEYQVKSMPQSGSASRASADMLDWSAKRMVDERHGPAGFDFYERCANCTNPLPPDLTFCFHCGGSPKRHHATTREFTIVIQEIESSAALKEGAELIAIAGESFGVPRTLEILNELPAAFMVTAPKQQVVALCGRLSDIGVFARAYPSGASAPINWVKEAAESMLRNPQLAAVVAFGVFALLVGGFLFSGFLFVLAPIFLFGALWVEWQRYQNEFSLDPIIGLNYVSGFDGELGKIAPELLSSIRHLGVRKKLTVCLIEYYALHQSLRTHVRIYGDALDGVFRDMRRLVDYVFNLALNVRSLERLPRESAIIADLDAMKVKVESAPNHLAVQLQKQVDVLERQLLESNRADEMIETIEQRLGEMNLALEALRFRLVTAEQTEFDLEKIEMDTILEELESEFDVFSQTMGDLGNL